MQRTTIEARDREAIPESQRVTVPSPIPPVLLAEALARRPSGYLVVNEAAVERIRRLRGSR